MKAELREYRREDRAGLREVCHETGLLGGSLRGVLTDAELFLDLATQCFLEDAAGRARVAVIGGLLCGYVLYTADSSAIARCRRRSFPRRILRELPRLPQLDSASRACYGRYLGAFLRGELRLPPAPDYPGELHINVRPGHQGAGIGSALMQAALADLRSAGVPGVHLQTSSANHSMLAFLERQGWRRLAERRTELYQPYGHPGLLLLQFGLRLN